MGKPWPEAHSVGVYSASDPPLSEEESVCALCFRRYARLLCRDILLEGEPCCGS